MDVVKKNLISLLGLVTFALLIRFPYFSSYVLNWDESTFILVGDAWSKGSLPYTDLWDLKQPLLFAFFKVVILVFGKSIFMIRLMGALVISVSAFFVFLIGRKIGNTGVGFFSGFLFVFLSSFEGSSQCVMSEHITLFFLMPVIYILMFAPKYRIFFFLGGFLLGLSCLVRINIAFIALCMGIYFIFKPFGFWRNVWNNMLFSFGYSIAFLLSFLNYFIEGYGKTWWETVVVAPFHYGNNQEIVRVSVENHLKLFLIMGLLMIGYYYLVKKEFIAIKWKFEWMILILSALGIELSFLKSGNIFSHYMLQIYPFLLLFAIYLLNTYLSKSYSSPKIINRTFILISTVLSLIMVFNILTENWDEKREENSAVMQISSYLNKNLNEKDKVYITTYHVIYWLIDKKPMSKATTHPSNITKTYLFPYMNEVGETSLEKLDNLFGQQPRYILATEKIWYFDQTLQNRFDEELEQNYKLVLKTDNNLVLYERMKSF